MRHSSTAIKNNDAEEYLMKKMMFMIFFFKAVHKPLGRM